MSWPIVVGLAVMVVFAGVAGGREAALSVETGKVVGQIDEKVYGQFLEHIFHSVNGGLWGDLVWDRSFESGPGGEGWSEKDGCLIQHGHGANVRLMFGDTKWTDYEFTLEAQKIGGAEGFLVLFRETSKDDFYWANLGGWGNRQHGLERGVKGQGRWGRVGKAAPGQIETDKWYRIRVRCEGPRVQVFLDGQRLLDFTDTDHPHLAGRVGVGTWETSARFRNLKVAALDGKVLFEGLPKAIPAPPEQPGWATYGKGQMERVQGEALNGEYCQLIAPAGADEAGVRQRPVCVRAGETYHGSLWARGRGGQIVVRLVDGPGGKLLAEQSLGAPKETWGELPLTLRPAEACDSAELQVGVRGGKVWIDQVSLMSDSARKVGGFRPDLLKAIADLRPPVIRWPGGSFASLYRWKDGIGPQHKRGKYPRRIWDDQDVNAFGTDEFIALCRRVGTQPLIVVDIGMHAPPEQRDEYCREASQWVEYCNGPADSQWGKVRAANGHVEPFGVKYWEIDNEVWRLKPDEYTPIVKQFVAAMKQVDPSIRVIACGSGQLGGHWGEGDTRVIADCAGIIDYLSVHHYESPDRFADGPAVEEKFLRDLGRQVSASANPNVRLYVSEWNAQSTDWRTGLYCGGILNTFERCCGIVGMAGPALFLRHVSARSWDNAFINFDHRTWFAAPNYVVMKLWRDHYAPNLLAVAGESAGVDAVATSSADGLTIHIKAVNPADEPVDVKVELRGGFQPASASLQIVAPDSLSARNTLDARDAVRPEPAPAALDGRTVSFRLPRWSAGVVTIGAK